MTWIDEFLHPLLKHRDAGHSLKFQIKRSVRSEAEVYCYQCRHTLMDGDRNMVHEIYEAVLQWPKPDHPSPAAQRRVA